MESLIPHLKSIKVPCGATNVHKDECVFSYDTPETPTGLYVCLKSFLGFGADYVAGFHQATGNAVFLHIFREKIELPGSGETQNEPEKKITRLAIGTEGGFDPNENKRKFEYKDHYNVVVYPDIVKIPYPNQDLPLIISNSVEAILAADSINARLEKESLSGTWDGEKRQVSGYANELQQLDNGKKIPPSGWKCEKCDLTNNLWLNLTDGSIMCGRRNFDGSGGNGHALEYYTEHQYPLAVKLGTITSDGKGDVYSYPEDDMVEDPKLIEHLAHFGIKINQLEKTEKSMIELELEINQRIGEWSLLTESSSNLEPISGPGYTGMKNLGNSCYMNSVMQTLFTIPDFVQRFVDKAPEIFSRYPADPINDFDVQFAKLGVGLCSGKYSAVAENSLDADSTGISPITFKNHIGRGHPDFAGKQQQDVQEFLLYVLNQLERHSRNSTNPADALKFEIEDRVECGTSGKVKYTKREDYCLSLHIPLSMATNQDEVHEYEERKQEAERRGEKLDPSQEVRPRIPLQYCLDRFAQVETVEQFYSSAIRGETVAKKTARLATMPDYLILHLKKFTLREDWTCVKLDVAVEIPDQLDLSALRSTGQQPNEEQLPELEQAPPQPQLDENIIAQLIDMGFPIEACKKAAFFTKNVSLEAATEWIMLHIADSDFGEPFVVPGTDASSKSTFTPDPNGLEMLMGMGFGEAHATKALKETNNNVERAADWIFSHQMEVDDWENGGAAENVDAGAAAASKCRDGNSQYKLVAFISHMGTSSQVGHYVCHILKNDKWVIFNDGKVAISQNPPKELGYMYLYQRQ